MNRKSASMGTLQNPIKNLSKYCIRQAKEEHWVKTYLALIKLHDFSAIIRKHLMTPEEQE